jgi:hypothetical protein
MNKIGIFFITVMVVMISRLPFLDAGYGTDPDAWRVAGTAKIISATGEYRASRLPGYPLQELTYSLISRKSPFWFNFCTAFLSALAVGFFSLILVHLGSRDVLLTSMALACVPVLYINSTTSMDYVWAFSAVMASLYFVTLRRPLVSGLLLGIAMGCRITSAVLSVPFLLILLSECDEKNFRFNSLLFLGSLSITAAIAFVPVLKKYGLGFLHFHEAGYPSFIDLIRTATIDVWGILGCVAITLALGATIVGGKSRRGDRSIPIPTSRWVVLAWVLAIALLVLLFARLPADAAYLLPGIPFVLFLFARFMDRRLFLTVCIVLICSPFVLSIDSLDRPWSPRPSSLSFSLVSKNRRLVVDVCKGAIVNDRERRFRRMEFVEKLLGLGEKLDKQSPVIAGVWLPQVIVMGGGAMPPDVRESPPFRYGHADFVGLVDRPTAQWLRDAGEQIYFVPGQDVYNLKSFGVDLRGMGAIEIR